MNKFYKLSLPLLFLWLSTGMAWAQISVSGTVTDERTSEPLIGASILIKGTTTGTITDIDGNFSLSIQNADGATLVVSSIGYLTKEINVSSSMSNLNIQLNQDATNLEEW